ncbi:MAG: hypothetical protein MZU91_10810 [Desulfosudis oleivorans]|nr:hypothetical protein [Desulfosudis oleivorans]
MAEVAPQLRFELDARRQGVRRGLLGLEGGPDLIGLGLGFAAGLVRGDALELVLPGGSGCCPP